MVECNRCLFCSHFGISLKKKGDITLLAENSVVMNPWCSRRCLVVQGVLHGLFRHGGIKMRGHAEREQSKALGRVSVGFGAGGAGAWCARGSIGGVVVCGDGVLGVCESGNFVGVLAVSGVECLSRVVCECAFWRAVAVAKA